MRLNFYAPSPVTVCSQAFSKLFLELSKLFPLRRGFYFHFSVFHPPVPRDDFFLVSTNVFLARETFLLHPCSTSNAFYVNFMIVLQNTKLSSKTFVFVINGDVVLRVRILFENYPPRTLHRRTTVLDLVIIWFQGSLFSSCWHRITWFLSHHHDHGIGIRRTMNKHRKAVWKCGFRVLISNLQSFLNSSKEFRNVFCWKDRQFVLKEGFFETWDSSWSRNKLHSQWSSTDDNDDRSCQCRHS